MRKWLFVIAILLGVSLSLGAASYALSMFDKTVAGLGTVKITGQVDVTDISITSPTTIEVRLASNPRTPVGKAYEAHLYLDGVDTGMQLLGWGTGQSGSNTRKLTFEGLDLASVTSYGVEIRPSPGLLAPPPNTPAPTSTSTPTSTPAPTPSLISYATGVQPIFNQYCTACHSGSNAPKGYEWTSYAKVMASGKVIAGNAAGSKLYQMINAGMPPGGSIPAASKQTIGDWINQGALNN